MEKLIKESDVISIILSSSFSKKDITAYEMIEEIKKINEPSIKKTIELPCYIGDVVYHIQFPTQVTDKSSPTIVEMIVTEVSYVVNSKYDKLRIDVSYKNKLGDDSFDFYIWSHGELYTSRRDAEEKLCSLKY